MKFLSFSSFGIVILLLFTVVLLLNKPVQADDCCPPPLAPTVAARFQQNAQVTVYLDTTTGFTDVERQAIKAGLEDWNDEPNNSGVTYTVIETDNPPAPGGNNTIIATFINSPGSTDAALSSFRLPLNFTRLRRLELPRSSWSPDSRNTKMRMEIHSSTVRKSATLKASRWVAGSTTCF